MMGSFQLHSQAVKENICAWTTCTLCNKKCWSNYTRSKTEIPLCMTDNRHIGHDERCCMYRSAPDTVLQAPSPRAWTLRLPDHGRLYLSPTPKELENPEASWPQGELHVRRSGKKALKGWKQRLDYIRRVKSSLPSQISMDWRVWRLSALGVVFNILLDLCCHPRRGNFKSIGGNIPSFEKFVWKISVMSKWKCCRNVGSTDWIF